VVHIVGVRVVVGSYEIIVGRASVVKLVVKASGGEQPGGGVN
jgi:hypothetical protein